MSEFIMHHEPRSILEAEERLATDEGLGDTEDIDGLVTAPMTDEIEKS